MNYIPHTTEEIKQMLEVIGVSSIEELFGDISPYLKAKSFDLPEGKSEQEVMSYLKKLAAKNISPINFMGAGFYDHYIPAVVNKLAERSEFYTNYTPYQPECAQGTLQSIYEYQTAICNLTGMEAANASLYDGGTALAEAIMMAIKITGKNKIIISKNVNPIYRDIIRTSMFNHSIKFVEIPVKFGQDKRSYLFQHLDHTTAAVVLQNPDFFGVIDDYSDIVEPFHYYGALIIGSVYPLSLGILKTPGEMGIDIVVGEGQSLGLPLSFGGPYLGFMATKKKFVRKMPGRIVGATVDTNNKRSFVLTLQAREQHIKRVKATSNICSNNALCALRAIIYLSVMGKRGLAEVASLNFNKAMFAKELLGKINGVKIEKDLPIFNEFVIELPKEAKEVIKPMLKKGFIAGFPLGKYYEKSNKSLLVTVTEKRTKEEI
ncbi:aminomethyl-transferring glycine dehydrogenase subunit GcvPA, partial [bacterium]|nr:aminomethyl-transferring glycine dehydrogenase subunit GcvPA [bacterium]